MHGTRALPKTPRRTPTEIEVVLLAVDSKDGTYIRPVKTEKVKWADGSSFPIVHVLHARRRSLQIEKL